MLAPKSWILLRVAPLFLVGLGVGCDPIYADLYTCPDPDVGHQTADGRDDPCHELDPDAGAGCDGTCVPVWPPAWSEPVLFWHGPPADLPECPSWAPTRSDEGNADLTSPPTTCIACECKPPTGTCGLPATIRATNAPICTMPGTLWAPFDPPVGWAGECTQANAIPAGELCGGVPCVQTVSIGPLSLTENGCTPTLPSPPGLAPGSPTWGTAAIACSSNHLGQCSDSGETCAPNLPPLPTGFQLCISALGDNKCFESYPTKYLTYLDHYDGRACSPCACNPPSGSTCTGTISIFEDSACSALVLALKVGNEGPTCHEVLPGSGLASKSAGPLTYTAGMCQPSGGEPIGAAEPTNPKTFCCRP